MCLLVHVPEECDVLFSYMDERDLFILKTQDDFNFPTPSMPKDRMRLICQVEYRTCEFGAEALAVNGDSHDTGKCYLVAISKLDERHPRCRGMFHHLCLFRHVIPSD